jgi:hypothetical protein
LNTKSGGHPPATALGQFGGIEDAIILPLVLIAVAAKNLFQATLPILIHILDYAFPILLQLVRFPLFTVRIIGDGVRALLKWIVGCLPVSGTTRDDWRESLRRRWSSPRQKISYKAFEEIVHHAFEGGMAWVFKKCRTLTPRGALLIIAGAVLWLPMSLMAATAKHVVLVAQAASLPPWMQMLPGDHYRQKQASGVACISGPLASGEETFVCAGDVPVLSLFHGSSSHSKDGISLPAHGTRLCGGGRCLEAGCLPRRPELFVR